MNRRSFFSAFAGAGVAPAIQAAPPKPKFITVPFGIMCLGCKRYVLGAPGDTGNLVDYIGQYGLLTGMGHFLGNKLGPFAKTIEQEIANEDELGRPLVRRGKPGKVEVFGHVFVRKAPSSVVGTVKGVEQAAKNIVPAPFSLSTLGQMAMDPKRKYTLQEYIFTAINGRRPSRVEATTH